MIIKIWIIVKWLWIYLLKKEKNKVENKDFLYKYYKN